jgi:alpha-amylase/alpha-mannosidase (GH57 family)
MHQPDYREPNSQRLSMPWVRLHALKDYLDMPLRAGSFDSLRLTFNLVPSLLDQLEAYTNGAVDRHLELSRLPADGLSPALKIEIIDSFFTGNPTHMINAYPRYQQLYAKAKGGGSDSNLASLFSSSEIRDLQVWSNLSWIDPYFHDESPVRNLLAKERYFTEEDKQALLDWQIRLIGRIVPVYRQLMESGQIEVSFTPYYHPILPLLCDSDIAREALPSVKLPKQRFMHPEDAERQIVRSIEKYQQLFGRPMRGMWPSEGSVSEQVVELASRHGVTWLATDEEILYHSLTKSGLDRNANPLQTVYRFGDGAHLLFRDHALSDRIGFVYSGWEADRAVSDFIEHILNLRTLLVDQLDRVVVPIILDGENAWEYFPKDGAEFLTKLYTALTTEPRISTVTFSEAVAAIEPRPLPALFAGSWINHSFGIWIGHDEDNTAWDLLSKTRNMLVEFEQTHPEFNKEQLTKAWEQIYVAEGSDWNWWYGDEHRSAYRDQFDRTYRRHLTAVYEMLGLPTPAEFSRPIFERPVSSFVHLPDQMITPAIDGRVTHFYEWTGAGYFDCLKAGGAMHRMDQKISGIYFGYDRENVYIRLDFIGRTELESVRKSECVITFHAADQIEIPVAAAQAGRMASVRAQFGEVVELSVPRSHLWPEGFGQLGITVGIFDQGRPMEQWPEDEPIGFKIPEPHAEIVWPI